MPSEPADAIQVMPKRCDFGAIGSGRLEALFEDCVFA